MGHVTLTTPLSGWFVIFSCDLLRAIYLPNLKSLSPPVTKIFKVTQNIENGVIRVVRVTQGRWKWHSTEHLRLYFALFLRYGEIFVKNRRL